MTALTVHTHPRAADVALSIRHHPTHTLVALRGEIDIVTAPTLRERLRGLLRSGMKLLVLDLAEVSFCDATGLAVMIGTQRRATSLGITLRLVSPRPQITAVLRITGLDRSLHIHRTLSDALAAGRDRRRWK
jgi:anti-anti-sigma factor